MMAFVLNLNVIELSDVEVLASRADEKTPVAYSMVTKEDMEVRLGSQDIPMVLNTTPSVYATQQGGGAGDARINVRGFNQRNVAVMINGVPQNDMENGWVYWSNWFGLDGLTRTIQVQRGLGASKLALPSVGGTINKVIKRDFSRNLRLLDYKTTTGFLSLYYASPLYNYDFALHIGKYLAKDKGATFEIRRTFDNGFSVGAFATFTNVSASDFGEGSFDKGLYFKIPFNTFTQYDNKGSYSTIIRSLQRDGGQKLDDYTGRLWFDLRGVRYDSFINNKKRMIPK